MRGLEILSPAGDMERLKMSVLYGADAVYLAGTSFGMRSFAGNFSPEELPAAVQLFGNMFAVMYAGLQQHFGIAICFEPVAQGTKRLPQLRGVVQLAVICNYIIFSNNFIKRFLH